MLIVIESFIGLSERAESYKVSERIIHRLMSMEKELPLITRTQLALRNGQDKPEIWIAFRNDVYEVTASRLWRDGKHYEHWAGQDLTDELKDAPHTEEVFKKFRIIGKLDTR